VLGNYIYREYGLTEFSTFLAEYFTARSWLAMLVFYAFSLWTFAFIMINFPVFGGIFLGISMERTNSRHDGLLFYPQISPYSLSVCHICQVFGSLLYVGTLIKSSFSGQNRSETRLPYRGKGLPKIKALLDKGLITKLRVISRFGYYIGESDSYKNLDKEYRGTLISWEFTKDGGCND
jgi:hypothetical protein